MKKNWKKKFLKESAFTEYKKWKRNSFKDYWLSYFKKFNDENLFFSKNAIKKVTF